MIQSPINNVVWLDLETTGLDPDTCEILEIAFRFCPGGPLAISTVNFARTLPSRIDPLTWDPFVREMHTKNGLLEECGIMKFDAGQLGRTEAEILRLLGRPIPRSLTLAGDSVHFDYGFLKKYMPDLAKCFSHRLFDVSAISKAAQDVGYVERERVTAHRAMSDVLASIARYDAIKAWHLRTPGPYAPLSA